jgi:hypothetical protein
MSARLLRAALSVPWFDGGGRYNARSGSQSREERRVGGAAMPVISKEEAVERMIRQVEKYDPAELLEVHNELFPNEQRTEAEVRQDPTPLIKRLVDYIRGREIDGLVFLWGFIFPVRYRNIWYEEEEDGIHYDEPDAVPAE